MIELHVRSWLRAGAVVCIVSSGLAACGGDDGPGSDVADGAGGEDGNGTGGSAGSGNASGSSDAERFLQEYAASVCAMYEPCCGDAELGFSASGCRDWF